MALGPAALALILVALVTRSQAGDELPVAGERLERPPSTEHKVERRTLADRAKEILSARIAEPLDLGSLAAALYCSPSHLCRRFSRETGTTLSSELRRLRVGQAMLRLLAGEPDLAALASDLGFASHSHFSGDFRRVTGASPSEFRAWSLHAGWVEAASETSRRAPPPDRSPFRPRSFAAVASLGG